MADPEKIKEEAKKGIRSLLVSCKEGLTLSALERDYRDFLGGPMPFSKLGYSSATQLLAQMPDVCRKTYDKSGKEVYIGIADETTAHIAQLVANQKGKKPRKGGKFSSHSRNPRSNYSFRASTKYIPPAPSYRGGAPKYGSTRQSSHPSKPRITYPHHNPHHPVHNAKQWPSAPKQGYGSSVNGISHTSKKPQNTANRPAPMLNIVSPNKPDPKKKQSEKEVRENMAKLLSAYPNGVWLHMLSDIYLGVIGLNLPPEFLDCVLDWTDLVQVEAMYGKKLLYPASEESKQAASAASLSNGSKKTAAAANFSNGSSHSADEEDLRTDFQGEIRPPPSFLAGEEYSVFVSHVTPSMEKIYLHRDDSCIDTLMIDLEKHFSSATMKKHKEIPNNCLCAVKDSAFLAWNRSAVIQTDHTTKAKVFFLDFGNSETKNLEEIQALPTHLTKEPAQAAAVSLYNITSRDMSLLSKEFSALTEQVPLKGVCVSVVDGNCSMVLYDSSDLSASLNEKLVKLGLASWANPELPIPSLTANAQQSTAKPLESQTPSIRKQASVTSISSTSSTAEPSEAPLPDAEYWTVLITQVVSPSKVYLQIRDESSEDFLKFQEEVGQVYKHEKPIFLLIIGNLYIAEDGGGWYRVRALELLNRNTVECEFVDYGSTSSVDRKNMYLITDEYTSLPYQARLCSLYGLDQLEDDADGSIVNKLDEMTDDKTLIAQLITVEQGTPHIVLFDTSGDDDVEINKEMGQLVTDNRLTSKLPEPGQTTDVVLTYIERDGTFYVQMVGPAYVCLQDLMGGINDYYLKQKTTAQDFVTRPVAGDSLCARYEKLWYRAAIMEVLPDKKVKVFYSDYGNMSTIPISQLRKLPEDVKHVRTLPMQAIPCKLSGLDDWNDDVGVEAVQLVESAESYVLMTVKAAMETEVARVQLSQNNLLVNNHLLKVYEESVAQVAKDESPITPKPAISTPASELQPSTSTAPITEKLQQKPVSGRNQSLAEMSPSMTISHMESSLSASSAVPLPLSDDQESPGTPSDTPPDESELDAPELDTLKLRKSGLNDLSQAGAGDYVSGKLKQLHMEQESEYKCKTEYVTPPGVGEFWDVFVTTTNEPDHFVVISLAEIKELNKLIVCLDNEFKGSEPAVGFDPSPGDLCAGLSESDGYWYRVLILEGNISTKQKVLFADYGNYDYISIDKLRPLRKEHTTLRLQAVRAGLFDVAPAVGNCWTRQAIQAFIDMCNEKKLVAVIKSVERNKRLVDAGPSVLFELYDTENNGFEINIDAELVKRGHAKYI